MTNNNPCDCDALREADNRYNFVPCCVECHSEWNNAAIPLEPFEWESQHRHVCCNMINASWMYGIREYDVDQTPDSVLKTLIRKNCGGYTPSDEQIAQYFPERATG